MIIMRISFKMLMSFLLCLLFLQIDVAFSSSSSVPQLCSHEEAAALLQFKTSFSIVKNSILESWKEGTDCCSWDGVRCDNLTGRVIDLNLSFSELSGSFPSNLSLFFLNNLQSLVLSFTDFKGSIIPSEIGNLGSLETLTLMGCNLGGSIPSSLLNLTKLSILDLSFNSLSGPIPPIVYPYRLSKLSELRLNSNSLNGTIPPWIFTLPQLRSLDLSSNQLEGQVSQFRPNSLVNLAHLDMSYNRLNGSIPSLISNLVNLSFLSLSSNQFSGILEFDIFSNLQNLRDLDMSNISMSFRNGINASFTLPSLRSLYLSSCSLRKFPNFIRESTNLTSLYLSNNKIEGPIPEWMWDIGKDTLVGLSLSNNSLSGALEELPWKNIIFLDLQSNKFQGRLPIPPKGTTHFLVSNNCFNGQISAEVCNVDTFEIFDISHNNFSGKVHDCLLQMSSTRLRVLNLQANKFHGAIPSEFPKGCRLQNLNLQGNQMEGPFPRSLVNCGELEVLDVGNNKIKDSFPYWLESLPDLQVLVLRSNSFHGYVRSINNNKTNSPFPMLRVLDLSDNDFVGPLPARYIENFKAMVDIGNSLSYMQMRGIYSYHFSTFMTLKGHSMEMEKILTIFTSIDLSNNKFVGEIPSAIGRLHSLKGLNLSRNNLGGHIPPSLGKLTDIESLDMSSNALVGKIPEELASLMQLAIFNLSNNQLDGRIPQGNQFNTFRNDSYQGNVRLCGPPISKSCDGNGTTDQPRVSFQKRDEFWEFISWRVVGIGFGSGTIFGLLMGYLMFKTGKPKWFVSSVDFYQCLRGRRMNRARRRTQRRN